MPSDRGQPGTEPAGNWHPAHDSEWFRALAETAGLAVFVDAGGRLLYVNPAAVRLTGYSDRELLTMRIHDLVHPRNRHDITPRSSTAPADSEVFEPVDVNLVRKDGQHRWVALNATLLTSDGVCVRLTTALDITERKEMEVALGRYLELAHEAGQSVSWEWFTDDDRMVFSKSATDVLGVPAAHVPATGDELLRMIPEEDRLRISNSFRKIFKTGEPYSIEHRVQTPDGRTRWLAVSGHAVRSASGRVVRVAGVSADISGRRDAESALRQEKEHAQVTIESIGDGVIRTDAQGRVDFLNPAAERLIGIGLHDAHGRDLADVYNAADDNSGVSRPDPARRCLATGSRIEDPDPHLLRRKDGSRIYIRDSASPIRGADGTVTGSVLVFRDVTRLRNLEREMVHLATHDPLTGLLNRREFDRRLKETTTDTESAGHRHILCYLDLDDFKLVNDTCGHVAGDDLLRQLTSTLAGVVRPADTLARLGGDEFGILLKHRQIETAQGVARDILSAIERFRFSWNNRIFRIGASVGIVPFTGGVQSPAEILSAADAACYVAKDQGRNQIHVSVPDDSEIAARYTEMNWVQRISSALEEDRFRLYGQTIQPLLADGREELTEILLRLVDEDDKLVLPGQFIAAAERYRMMPAIDRWVFGTAAKIISRLRLHGGFDHRCFTINLSGQSFADASLLDFVLDRLEAGSIPPDVVCFEITETAAISNFAKARAFITDLTDRGCRFILDDFGSGLSSFAYLRNLPVDFLKIDGDLVRGVEHSPVQREMVAAIHRIGHVMQVKTIAEWVETKEAADTLREIGVDFAQGFWFGAPSPFVFSG